MITEQTDIDEVLALVARYSRHFAQGPDAEDLAQVTIIKAWRGWKPEMAVWSDAQLKAWLWQIMQRTAIDRARKLSNQETTELDESCATSGSIETDVERRELTNATFARLTKEQCVLLILNAQGYTYREIAERENITRPAVAHRLMRARQSFKREWDTQVAA